MRFCGLCLTSLFGGEKGVAEEKEEGKDPDELKIAVRYLPLLTAYVTSDSSHRLHIAGPVAIGWAGQARHSETVTGEDTGGADLK